MEYRLLGGSGFKVPALALGTATFGGGNEFFRAWGATDVAKATRLVDVALDAGLNLFAARDRAPASAATLTSALMVIGNAYITGQTIQVNGGMHFL